MGPERRSSRRQGTSRTAKNEETYEKIRQLKGKKNKYELVEEKPVYDIVDEAQYSRLVTDRQKDDWIVDDAFGGYCEDGREIFDEDGDSESGDEYEDSGSKRVQKKKQKVRRHLPAGQEDEADDQARSGNRNIMDMIRGMHGKAPRKRHEEVAVKDEDLLANILEKDFGSCEVPAPKPLSAPSGRVVLKKKQQVQKTVPRKTVEQVKRGVEESLDIDALDDVIQPPTKKLSTSDRFDYILETDSSVHQSRNKPSASQTTAKPDDSQLQDYESEFQSFGDDADQPMSEPAALPPSAELEYEYFTDEVTSDKYLKFYWIDVHETLTMPGTVFVFGKIFAKSADCFVNACVVVKNIDKQLFFLRSDQENGEENAADKLLYDEFKELAKKLKIGKYKSKPTRKKYAFDKVGVPDEGSYLEVHVPASCSIPAEYQKGKNYACVFGTNQSSLERLVLDRKMRGPGWMRLTNASPSTSAPISWCKTEFLLNSMKDLSVDAANSDPAPPVTVLSIGVKTLVNRSSLTSEIIAISGFVENNFNLENGTSTNKRIFSNHFCLVTKPSQSFQKIFPVDLIPSKIGQQYKQTKLEIANNERELLNLFVAKFFRIDADVIVGHDIVDFDMDVLTQRLMHHKVGSWSKLGRLRRSGPVPIRKRDRIGMTCGRSIVDIKISARELIKSKSYDLTELAHQVLGETRRDIDQEVLLSSYDRLQDFLKMIGWVMRDNQLTYRMLVELSVLPLALQITKIAGNSFSRTLLGGRSERNEFLLLHAFHDANYICPDKFYLSKWTTGDQKQSNDSEATGNKSQQQPTAVKKKAAYAGGLVLDPKIGYYTDYVLILDFNSLYPTIVREFNICFSTINLRALPPPQFAEDADCESLPALPDESVKQGILPIEITRLVESRREVKKLLRDSDLSKDLQVQYDIKQKALKLTANSMYGCLGFGNSRFYAKPLAALITSKGREILMKTKNLVEELGYEVIYGDTDSIMINTRSAEVADAVKISNLVQSKVNGMHKFLEIECDGILKSMLLLKKKKYAALVVKRAADNSVTYHKEMKGLDIVRRDWSVIAKTVGEQVVNEILSIDKTIETVVDNIHQYLKQTAETLRTGGTKSKEFIQQFVISKQLTKNPEDYPDKKNLSHVSVALAFNAKTDKKLRAGDVVPFIVCRKISNAANFNALPATHRAFHPSEVMADEDLHVDVTYYLEQQIHPVVSRLVEPLDGTDAHSVAEFLGLDESFCPQRVVNAVDEIAAAGKHKFDICKSLLLRCPDAACSREIELREPFFSASADTKEWSLSRCPHCAVSFAGDKNGKRIEKMVKLRVKGLVDQLYALTFTCEDPMCGIKMSFSPATRVKRRGVECPECRALMMQDFPPPRFHLQLSFFEHIFNFKESDEDRQAAALPLPLTSSYSLRQNLLKYVRMTRLATSYNDVDLTAIFSNQIFNLIGHKKGDKTEASGVSETSTNQSV